MSNKVLLFQKQLRFSSVSTIAYSGCQIIRSKDANHLLDIFSEKHGKRPSVMFVLLLKVSFNVSETLDRTLA